MAGVDTRAALLRALEELQRQRAEIDVLRRHATEPIAVIGMACRFPGGSHTPDAYWDLLDAGRDAVTEIPAGRWPRNDYYDPDPATPGRMATMSGAFVDDVDRFDAAFFGIAPREAQSMDPQQRLLLEVAWEALEDAAIAPTALYGEPVGVFVGVTCFDHAIRLSRSIDNFNAYAGTGSALNMAPGRLSYVLGLTGPSLAIDTACSSSLVALHLASQSLRANECRLALAGGVHLVLSPDVMVSFSQARMLAADGRCKTFDAAADGYSRGEGCGVLVLKRLTDAVSDGDTILGVIRATAVNQDGPSGGLTVPNGLAQEAVIRRALATARLAPEAVDYVEAHGTGTPLGDPIEIEALARVYGEGRSPDRPLLVGAAKTNVGHLEPAAGMAGLIKILLAFRHGRIPRHLHVRTPNPRLDWAALPVRVASDPVPWPRSERPRVAGVSAFGFSGTNAHAVVEEPPATAGSTQAGPPIVLLALSAKSDAALRDLAARYSARFASGEIRDAAAAAFTAATGRAHFDHRLAIVASSVEEMAAALDGFVQGHASPAWQYGRSVEASYRRDEQDVAQALDRAYAIVGADPASREGFSSLAALYTSGATIDWLRLFPSGRPGRVRLPYYPFQRERYWVETGPPSSEAASAAAGEYTIEWPAIESATPDDDRRARRWLVSPSSSLAESVAAALGAGTARPVQTVDASSLSGVTDVVYVGGADADIDHVNGACADLLAIGRMVVSRPGTRLWVVTKGAAPIGAIRDESLAQAAIAAFARVFGLEHAEHFARIIDLDPEDASAAALAAELRRASAEDFVAIRNGRRHAPRVTPASVEHVEPTALREDAAYLVTGGLGALGLKVARWLVEQGARRLCLAGRSGVSTIAQRLAVDALRAQGVEVEAVELDVADRAAVAALVRTLDSRDAGLRGVVHAAGVEGYVAFDELTPAIVAAVLHPKTMGARVLHEATAGVPLDFFVCFSSIASAWGSRGQAHYAAANASLDALAHLRRAAGLPAVSINWGPWADGGMNSAETDALLRRAGVRPLATRTALAEIGRAIGSGHPQVIAADIDWRLFSGSYEARGARPLLERVRQARAASAGGSSPLAVRVETLPAAAWLQSLVEFVQGESAQALGAAASGVEADRGLFEMGMDSLMALELRTRLETAAGGPLPATLIFDYPTPRAIAQLLLDRVAGAHAPAAPPPRRPALAAPLASPAPARDLDSLSDAEAEALLLSRLDSLDTGD